MRPRSSTCAPSVTTPAEHRLGRAVFGDFIRFVVTITNMAPQAVPSAGAGSPGVVSSMPHVSSHADSPAAHGDTWPIGHRPHLPPPDPTWACGLTRCRTWVPGPERALCMPGWLGPDSQGHSPTYSGLHNVTSSPPAPHSSPASVSRCRLRCMWAVKAGPAREAGQCESRGWWGLSGLGSEMWDSSCQTLQFPQRRGGGGGEGDHTDQHSLRRRSHQTVACPSSEAGGAQPQEGTILAPGGLGVRPGEGCGQLPPVGLQKRLGGLWLL